MKKLILFFFLFLQFLPHIAKSKVLLQPHQKKTIQHLLSQPNQTGFIIYHALGTGKTFLSLEYCERNPSHSIVILVPNFLKPHWVSQMKAYGILDETRYQIFTYSEIDLFLKKDLKNSILIIDEAHKFIQYFSQEEAIEKRDLFSEAYQHAHLAHKRVLLTGTPIFFDTVDIAYLSNLVLSDATYPTSTQEFKNNYMKIKPITSLMRGHVMESKVFFSVIPLTIFLTGFVLIPPGNAVGILFSSLLSGIIVPSLNEIFPTSQIAFREFDNEKWKDFSLQYISYYNPDISDNNDYPSYQLIEQKVHYNEEQTNFFLDFTDETLNTSEIKLLYSESNPGFSTEYIQLNATFLQKRLLLNPVSGREIGNLAFRTVDNSIIEPPKFLSILAEIKKTDGQVAIYSNYYQLGILQFKDFLDRNGYQNSYTVLEPTLSTEEYTKRIDTYNQQQKKIILIHPEITEGISLLGTQQLHILEPMHNTQLQSQIIGRVIRFQSHTHLPKAQQHVNIYLWESIIKYSTGFIIRFPYQASFVKEKHWQQNYSEVLPNMWTKGIVEIDKNYYLKEETPDSRVKRNQLSLNKDLTSFQALLQKYSIEHNTLP